MAWRTWYGKCWTQNKGLLRSIGLMASMGRLCRWILRQMNFVKYPLSLLVVSPEPQRALQYAKGGHSENYLLKSKKVFTHSYRIRGAEVCQFVWPNFCRTLLLIERGLSEHYWDTYARETKPPCVRTWKYQNMISVEECTGAFGVLVAAILMATVALTSEIVYNRKLSLDGWSKCKWHAFYIVSKCSMLGKMRNQMLINLPL